MTPLETELLAACREALAVLMDLSTEEFQRGGDKPAREALARAIHAATGEAPDS